MSENSDILAVTGLDDSVLKSGFQGKTPFDKPFGKE